MLLMNSAMCRIAVSLRAQYLVFCDVSHGLIGREDVRLFVHKTT